MRSRQAYAALLLCVLAACSTFTNRRIVQYNALIEEGYKQVEIYLDSDKLSPEDAKVILSSLDVAAKQVDRYWAAAKAGAPQEVKDVIVQAIKDALAEARKLLTEKQK